MNQETQRCQKGFVCSQFSSLNGINLIGMFIEWFFKKLFSSPDPFGSGELLSPLFERPSSVVRPLTFHILINSSEATGPI